MRDLGGRTWEELEVVRHDSGHLLFSDCIRRMGPDGKFEEIACKVWVPNPEDQVMARVDARAWQKKLGDLDPDRDKDLFEEMEQLCLLARCVRTYEAPHSQLCGHDELVRYDESSLKDVRERLNVYKAMLDPRADNDIVDDKSFWDAVLRIRKLGHLGPLVDIAPHAQPSFVLRMAREASSSPTAPSSVRSFESSTPEPSPSAS